MDNGIFVAYSTVLELLADRGYSVPKKLQFDSLEDLAKKFKDRNSIDLQTKKPNDPTDTIVVYFFGDPKPVSIASFRSRIKEVTANGYKKSIFVSREPKAFTSTSLKELVRDLGSGNVTVFNEKELAFNITKHILVPRHELISEEEKQRVLTLYQAREEQIPSIYMSDPPSKYFGFQVGDMIKIHRKSESAGEYLHYRIVVPDPDK